MPNKPFQACQCIILHTNSYASSSTSYLLNSLPTHPSQLTKVKQQKQHSIDKHILSKRIQVIFAGHTISGNFSCGGQLRSLKTFIASTETSWQYSQS